MPMAMAAGPYATQLGWPQDVKISIQVDFYGYMKNLISIIYRFRYGIASSILVSPRGTVIGIISKKTEQPSKPRLNYSGVQVRDQT
jgi:hypothetical protein